MTSWGWFCPPIPLALAGWWNPRGRCGRHLCAGLPRCGSTEATVMARIRSLMLSTLARFARIHQRGRALICPMLSPRPPPPWSKVGTGILCAGHVHLGAAALTGGSRFPWCNPTPLSPRFRGQGRAIDTPRVGNLLWTLSTLRLRRSSQGTKRSRDFVNVGCTPFPAVASPRLFAARLTGSRPRAPVHPSGHRRSADRILFRHVVGGDADVGHGAVLAPLAADEGVLRV